MGPDRYSNSCEMRSMINRTVAENPTGVSIGLFYASKLLEVPKGK
jgi:hypothetical protein